MVRMLWGGFEVLQQGLRPVISHRQLSITTARLMHNDTHTKIGSYLNKAKIQLDDKNEKALIYRCKYHSLLKSTSKSLL